jgi:hypothetical protein
MYACKSAMSRTLLLACGPGVQLLNWHTGVGLLDGHAGVGLLRPGWACGRGRLLGPPGVHDAIQGWEARRRVELLKFRLDNIARMLLDELPLLARAP